MGLVRYNRQSNDDHVQVMELILKTNRLPEKADCSECFQPKLFHYSVAKLLRRTGLEHIKRDEMILVVELVNFAAGLLTLLVVGFFIYRWPGKSQLLKVLAFGLVALNPTLIGINSQATNDSFAILFSTLALYFAYAYIQNEKPLVFLPMAFFVVLGIATKTNNWVTALAIFLALVIKAWTERQSWPRTVLPALLFSLVTLILSIVNPLNQYFSNLREYGSPLLLNIEKQPLPHLFEQIPVPLVDGPGILSVQDGYFTFKFIELLRHPRIEVGTVYLAPRTSLWTLLYGRAHSIHFENFPESWSTAGEQGFMLSRAIYILALPPTLLLLLGAVMETILVLKGIVRRDASIARASRHGLTAGTFAGFILFICLYALEYRDYPVMRAIFIYPALITFPVLFLRAGEALFSRLGQWLRPVRAMLGIWLLALLVLYIADVSTMIALIYSRRSGA